MHIGSCRIYRVDLVSRVVVHMPCDTREGYVDHLDVITTSMCLSTLVIVVAQWPNVATALQLITNLLAKDAFQPLLQVPRNVGNLVLLDWLEEISGSDISCIGLAIAHAVIYKDVVQLHTNRYHEHHPLKLAAHGPSQNTEPLYQQSKSTLDVDSTP